MEKRTYTSEEIRREAELAAKRQIEQGLEYRYVGIMDMIGELPHHQYVLFNTTVISEVARLQENQEKK